MKFEKGDEVIMLKKSIGSDKLNSHVMTHATNMLGFVTKVRKSEGYYVVDIAAGSDSGDFFLEDDLDYAYKKKVVMHLLKR